MVVRLKEGDGVEVGSFRDFGTAMEGAQEVIEQFSTATDGQWPFYAGRFIRPDLIVSVDVVEGGPSSSRRDQRRSSRRSLSALLAAGRLLVDDLPDLARVPDALRKRLHLEPGRLQLCARFVGVRLSTSGTPLTTALGPSETFSWIRVPRFCAVPPSGACETTVPCTSSEAT